MWHSWNPYDIIWKNQNPRQDLPTTIPYDPKCCVHHKNISKTPSPYIPECDFYKHIDTMTFIRG